jgi:hypothetical protein
MGNSCVPRVAGIEVKVKLDNSRKRARQDIHVSVHAVYREELSSARKGNRHTKYYNVKIPLREERQKSLGTEQNPEDSSKTVFSEEVLHLANDASFLRIDHTSDSGKNYSCPHWGRLEAELPFF